jgi:microcystin-dependent protein
MEPFIGQIMMFGGNFAPRGWAHCDGQLLPISNYAALFSIVGTTYGGDGRSTFALPDLRGRLPMHPGNGPGLSTRRAGEKSGTESVTLNAEQLPNHSHTISVSSQQANSPDPSGRIPAQATEQSGGTGSRPQPVNAYTDANGDKTLRANTVASAGNNQPVNTTPPFLCVNFIIALEGTFPSRN